MRQPIHIAIIAFVLFMTMAFTWLGVAELYRWSLLHGTTHSNIARVTDSRESSCAGLGCYGADSPYEIKYLLKISNDPSSYTYTGQSLFISRWVRIPAQEWNNAKVSNTIKVIYAYSNPRVNQPFATALPSLHNGIGFVLLALFSLFLTAFLVRNKKI